MDSSTEAPSMNTKPIIPRKLNLVWGFLGGITCVLLTEVSITLLLYSGIETQPSEMEAFGFMILWILCSWIPAAVLGAILGIILGRRGYLITSAKWNSLNISIARALLGGLAGFLLFLLLVFLAVAPMIVRGILMRF